MNHDKSSDWQGLHVSVGVNQKGIDTGPTKSKRSGLRRRELGSGVLLICYMVQILGFSLSVGGVKTVLGVNTGWVALIAVAVSIRMQRALSNSSQGYPKWALKNPPDWAVDLGIACRNTTMWLGWFYIGKSLWSVFGMYALGVTAIVVFLGNLAYRKVTYHPATYMRKSVHPLDVEKLQSEDTGLIWKSKSTDWMNGD